MAPRQKIRIPFAEIDLNVDPNIDCGDRQLEKEPIHDLTVDVDESILERDFDLNSTPNEISSSSHDMLLEEQLIEDDEQLEEGIQTNQTTLESNAEMSSAPSVKNKNLSNVERQAIYDLLLQKSVDGKLKKGTTNLVASLFSVHITTVQRIWKRGQKSGVFADVSSQRTKNCGRKRVHVDLEQIREVPLHKRTTIRSLAHAVTIPKSTLFRLFQEGEIRRHSSPVKPFLTKDNKRSRLQFCLDMLEEGSLPHNPSFKAMYNTVHIDEKWFFMTKKAQKFYMLRNEPDPYRPCKSKNFIVKVMFFVALARPRYDANGNEQFSGKIGVFPFVIQEPARRNSVNRPAGTLVTKPINSVTKDVVRSYLIEKILPAIKEKWPRDDLGSPIFIQQDNARTHVDCNDYAFCEAATRDGFDIRLLCQPPNSPDLNVLDLGFFSAIQSLQQRESMRSIDELISVVVKAFEEFSSVNSNRIFLSLQLCMQEIMRCKGSNQYKVPHIKKEILEREGQLPIQVGCEPKLVEEVRNYLHNVD